MMVSDPETARALTILSMLCLRIIKGATTNESRFYIRSSEEGYRIHIRDGTLHTGKGPGLESSTG
jgi:hypothetical protein